MMRSVPVTLSRYLGVWYEAARLPAPFEWRCGQGRAIYEAIVPDTISILNECTDPTGPRQIRGVGQVVGPGQLLVSFVGAPQQGQYWILAVDEPPRGAPYTLAVVGEPSRSFLWLLSRTPSLHPDVLRFMLGVAIANGYTPEQLARLEVFG